MITDGDLLAADRAGLALFQQLRAREQPVGVEALERGFDPLAPDDTLTIRRCPPGESNLTWDGARFIGSPDPVWLDRYFPGLHDNAEEIPLGNPGPMPPDPDDESDVLSLQGQTPDEWRYEYEEEERDTFCVNYRDLKLGPDSLSFGIQQPQSPDTDEVPNVVPAFRGPNSSPG